MGKLPKQRFFLERPGCHADIKTRWIARNLALIRIIRERKRRAPELVDSWSGCKFFFDNSWYANVILQSLKLPSRQTGGHPDESSRLMRKCSTHSELIHSPCRRLAFLFKVKYVNLVTRRAWCDLDSFKYFWGFYVNFTINCNFTALF